MLVHSRLCRASSFRVELCVWNGHLSYPLSVEKPALWDLDLLSTRRGFIRYKYITVRVAAGENSLELQDQSILSSKSHHAGLIKMHEPHFREK